MAKEDIDAKYGLEPVIEVDKGSARDASVDGFLDDCTVCCRPIACTLTVHGRRARLTTSRVG